MRRAGNTVSGLVDDLLPDVVIGNNLEPLLEAVNRKFNTTEEDFVRALSHKNITVADYTRWKTLATEWREFYLSFADEHFISPWRASAAGYEADQFDLERFAHHAWLKDIAPGEVTGPADTVVATDQKKKPSDVPWGMIAGAVGLVAVAYIVGPVIGVWANSKKKS